MKAFFIQEPGRGFIGEVEKPQVGEGEILLNIKKIGYCGSDLKSFRGQNPLVSYPRIPGHEISAVIEETAQGVPIEFQVGDAVTVVPYTNCGQCAACIQKRPNACKFNETLGVQREGALTEFIVVPWEKVLKANTLNASELSIVEPLAVGFHCSRRGQIEKGDIVLVFGCGMIGIGAICRALKSGAIVIAVDIDDEKLSLAKEIGAHFIINSLHCNLEKEVNKITNNMGPRVVLEAVGIGDTFILDVDMVSYAGRVVYVGYVADPVSYETKKFLLKELQIRGSRGAEKEDFVEVINYLQTVTSFPIERIITKEYEFTEAEKAFKEWDSHTRDFTKIIVKIS